MRLNRWCAWLLLFFAQSSQAAFDSDFYHKRYNLPDVYTKLVDNRGNGHEDLYGTRNFREVLNGVLYRGGGNNAFHRDPALKRANSNPLPIDGFTNLCEEGFRTVVYLYATNFDKVPQAVDCNSVRGPHRLPYDQMTAVSRYREILEKIFVAIHDPAKAPVYVHCWNGWHASGMISAMSLRQFCGYSAADTLAYWTKNTDGTDDGSYEGIKRRIREFQPYPDLLISPAIQAKICPTLAADLAAGVH